MSKECLNIIENDFNTKKMTEKFIKFIKEFFLNIYSKDNFVCRNFIL